MGEPGSNTKHSRRIRRVAPWTGRVFILLVAMLLAAEGGLRVAGAIILRQRAQAVERELASKPGAIRLLHIGESTTFGLGVKPEEAYPEVVARMLEVAYPGKKFVSFNRGVPSLTTAAMLRTLPEKLAVLRPQLVTISAGVNDHCTRLNWEISREQNHLPPWFYSRLSRVRLYKLVHWSVNLRQPGFKVVRGEVVYDDGGVYDSILFKPKLKKTADRVTAQFRANLSEMVRLCQKAGSQVLLVGYVHDAPVNKFLEELAGKLGVHYVSTFIPKEKRTRDLFIEDGWHPSMAGHRHIAGAIAKTMTELGIVVSEHASPKEGRQLARMNNFSRKSREAWLHVQASRHANFSLCAAQRLTGAETTRVVRPRSIMVWKCFG